MTEEESVKREYFLTDAKEVAKLLEEQILLKPDKSAMYFAVLFGVAEHVHMVENFRRNVIIREHAKKEKAAADAEKATQEFRKNIIL